MNYVAIDPSLSCTAMVVNGKKFVYTTDSVAHTKKGKLTRWFELCAENGIIIRPWEDLPEFKSNSDSEWGKLSRYISITDCIIDDIMSNIDYNNPVSLALEGYSHSSNAGPLIDLVTFSTLLRDKLLKKFTYYKSTNPSLTQVPPHLTTLLILQPTEVKQRAAALAYPPIKKGKKIEYRNAAGIAGGSFKKHQIYQALLDNTNLHNDPWVEFIRGHWNEVETMKSVPKPIEDINDAFTLFKIISLPAPLT